MAGEPTDGNVLIDIFNALPATLQGAFVVAVGGGFGYWLWRRFSARFHLDRQDDDSRQSIEVPGPETVLKELLKNVDLLTLQMMKTEALASAMLSATHDSMMAVAKAIERAADIAGQLLVDLRDEKEKRADDEQRHALIEEGKRLALEEIAAQRRERRRRPPVKKT